jgi:hypothetical protein
MADGDFAATGESDELAESLPREFLPLAMGDDRPEHVDLQLVKGVFPSY